MVDGYRRGIDPNPAKAAAASAWATDYWAVVHPFDLVTATIRNFMMGDEGEDRGSGPATATTIRASWR